MSKTIDSPFRGHFAQLSIVETIPILKTSEKGPEFGKYICTAQNDV